ncbi:MAG: hypothetical protein U1E65_06705 [Myxococcota bacterium]
MNPSFARKRARQAFQRGRLELGLWIALPFVALSGWAWLIHDRAPFSLILGGALSALAATMAAYGRGLDRLATVAAVLGLPAFLSPLCVSEEASLCLANLCFPGCLAACALGGLISGLAFASYLAKRSAPPLSAGLGALLLLGVGCLGCWGAGVPGLLGLAAGGALGGLPRLFWRPSSVH